MMHHSSSLSKRTALIIDTSHSDIMCMSEKKDVPNQSIIYVIFFVAGEIKCFFPTLSSSSSNVPVIFFSAAASSFDNHY